MKVLYRNIHGRLVCDEVKGAHTRINDNGSSYEVAASVDGTTQLSGVIASNLSKKEAENIVRQLYHEGFWSMPVDVEQEG